MIENKFKEGDIVRLKSGSPEMTVSFSDNDETYVFYYNYPENKISNQIKLKTCVLELVN